MVRSVAAVRARWADTVRRPASNRPRPVTAGRRKGGGYGPKVPDEVVRAIALDLVTVVEHPCHACGARRPRHLTYRQIAERHGVTYEQVRTVKRNLDLLAG